MFIMFVSTGKKIFDEQRLESIKRGTAHVSNRDYLLSIIRGFPQEEADEALKLSVIQRLYKLHGLPVTHVEYIDGHLMINLRILQCSKNKLIIQNFKIG